MDVFEIDIEAMVDSVSKLVTDTGTVLKIVVPCSFTGKEDPAVYHCHDGVVRTLTESDGVEAAQATVNLSGSLGVYQFIHIPKGSYLLSAEWTENDEPLSEEIPPTGHSFSEPQLSTDTDGNPAIRVRPFAVPAGKTRAGMNAVSLKQGN